MNFKKKTKKYNYFYKITNTLNNHYYYGVHCTDNLDDGYMGSGVRLHLAYKKYGIENFTKDILKFFDTNKEAYEYEAEVVTDSLVNDKECYNLCEGGFGSLGKCGVVTVRDKDGNTFSVSTDDPRYLSGELIPIQSGFVVVKDINENIYRVSIDDPRYLSGELKSISLGKIVVKDKEGITYSVSVNDPRYLSGELIACGVGKCVYKDSSGNIVYTDTHDPKVLDGTYTHITKGRITVKDKFGNFYSVYKDDPRYISGELVPNCVGHKLSEETKKKLSANHADNSGEKNGMFGKKWIHFKDDKNVVNKIVSTMLRQNSCLNYFIT